MNLPSNAENTEFIVLMVLVALAAAVFLTVAAMGIYIAYRRRHAEGRAQAEPMPASRETAEPVPAEEFAPAEAAGEVRTSGEVRRVLRCERSFAAKLIQSDDALKERYSALKNALLSYKKTGSRLSWHAESYHSGRTKLAKFAFRGKTLCLFLALDPDAYAGTQYRVERAGGKRYADVPCMYRIKNALRVRHACELIAALAERLGLEASGRAEENYAPPYEEDEALFARGLIRPIFEKAAAFAAEAASAEAAEVPAGEPSEGGVPDADLPQN